MATRDDLSMPTTVSEQQALMGPQTPHPLAKQIGIALLGMVAIHFGSYAIKNAGAKLIATHLSDVTFNARRTTTIAEDIFGVSRKLDRFSAEKIAAADAIPDGTALGRQFTLRAQARASQQLKRFPSEFVPAALVTAYTKPAKDNQGDTWNLKNIGETVAMYAGADIILGAAWKPLMQTQAFKFATQNLERQGPRASQFIVEQINKATIRGSSGAAALGEMYRGWAQAPPAERILSPKNIRKMWQAGQTKSAANKGTLQTLTHGVEFNWTYPQINAFEKGAKFAGDEGIKSAYSDTWIRNLMAQGNMTERQAVEVLGAVGTGRDFTSGFHVSLHEPRIVTGRKWYSRFGHSDETIVGSYKVMQDQLKNSVPQLANKTEAQLDTLFQGVTESTEVTKFETWRLATSSRGKVAPSSARPDLFVGGITQENQLRRMLAWFMQRNGVVDKDKTNFLGLRKVSVADTLNVLDVQAAGRGASEDLLKARTVWKTFDEQVAAISPGGKDGKLYKQWLNTAVDKNIYTAVRGTNRIQPTDVISLALARSKAISGLVKFSEYTKIPILGFNPVQLLQPKARAETPSLRWIPVGSTHPSLGGLTRTPTLQLGDQVYQWRGTRLAPPRLPRGMRASRDQAVRGSLIRRPERFNAYSVSQTSQMGRLVRNYMGMGMDQQAKEATRERWLYRNSYTRRIAQALDITPYTTGTIPGHVRNWMTGAPTLALSKKTAGRFPRISEWLGKRVPETYPTKEIEALLAPGGWRGTSADASRILSNISAEFHPGIPLQAARTSRNWLPQSYLQAPFLKEVPRPGQRPLLTHQRIPFTQAFIEDTVNERRSLLSILDDLKDDAIAQRGRGNQATWDLYQNLVSRSQREASEWWKAYPKEEGLLSDWSFMDFTVKDRMKRKIISYVLARPTTIGRVPGANQSDLLGRVMQISELDNLVAAIESGGGNYSSGVKAQIKGAVASMKLSAYKANYKNIDVQVAKIRADATLTGEIGSMVESWAKFPAGKAWRSEAHDPRNARSASNFFSDQYTYMEKFGSAWGRNPMGAMQGVVGSGGIRTGIGVGALHVVNRLRGAMRLLGMDFTEGKYTSMGDMLVGGYMLRRALPIMGAIGLYQWADWQSSKRTGTGLTEAAFRAGVVEPSIATSAVSEAIGMRKGFEWFGKVTGEEDRMNFLKYATKTPEELREFWNEGEVPVRRGRWWMLSPTPFEGQRTQFFVPNLYRRIQSRYKYTWEGGRGPEEFYFSHSWMPTPSYPLSPITRLLDPYAFEKETYQKRPYLLTGQFFNGPYGPLTPVLNATIGELIKPTKRMHPEGWSALESGFTPYGAPIEGINWPAPGEGVGGGGAGEGSFLGTGAMMTHAMLASANSGVVGRAMTQGASVGQPYGIGLQSTMMLMGQAGISMDAVNAATPPGIWTQTKAMGNTPEAMYRMQEMAGIYGFSVQAVRERMGMAPEYQQMSYIPRAEQAYGFQSQFWNMNLGGLGDFTLPGGGAISNLQFSEIFRRFVPMPPKSKRVNPVPNQVWRENPWLPGPYSGYFEDFSVGDIYNRPYGAAILPGEGYNRLYDTAPGSMGYSKLDQMRMLSKVAPWSREYKTLNRSLSRTDLAPEEREEYMNIRQQVEEINQKYQFAPYRFQGLDLEESSYEIMGVTDEGYLTARGARTPIKLAGIEPSARLAEELRKRIVPGQRMNVQLDTNRPRYSMEQQNAVLEAVIPGLNKDLIGEGFEEELGGSPLSYYARTNRAERAIGSLWEQATHTWNPFTTKFIQRRTALEQYERGDVYGKAYAPWSHPISSFITPFFQSVGARPLLSSIAVGAAFGAAAGRGPAKPFTALAGAAIMGLNKVRTMAQSAITGNAYIPHGTKERWEEEEYQDILQYVGAARNYSLLRRRAIAAGEQDPESLWRKDQSIKQYLSEGKTNLQATVLERSVYGGISQKQYFAENPIAEQAFSWREKMGKTEYGADLTGDYLALQQAIPKERRMYFEQFLNAPKKDRKRILSLLPRLERRIYQSAWGMPVEEKPGLNEYFDSHFLPGPEAAIWNSNVDWDKVKVRMIEQAGGQPSEYGYYPQEVQGAEMYPIPVPSADMSQHGNIKNILSQVLGGADIQGLSISVMPSSEPGFNVDMNITKDMYQAVSAMVKLGMT
jgi:hypothetical protein